MLLLLKGFEEACRGLEVLFELLRCQDYIVHQEKNNFIAGGNSFL
jgi:hypothetical protein